MAIKVGIIGAGGMLQYHAAGFRQAGAEIVAVADAAPGAAARAAEKWGIPKAYNSVNAMLKGSPGDQGGERHRPEQVPQAADDPVPPGGQARLFGKAAGDECQRSEGNHRRREEGRQEGALQLQQPRAS